MSGAVPPLPLYIFTVWTQTNLFLPFMPLLRKTTSIKTSSYKYHNEHPMDTILYGIKNSISTLGSSESNTLRDFCELSTQSILSQTTPCSVMQQASGLIQTSNLHHIGFPEFTIIFSFCFRRCHYCWVIPRLHLNYCLLLRSITLTLVEVWHGKVRLLDAY